MVSVSLCVVIDSKSIGVSIAFASLEVTLFNALLLGVLFSKASSEV